MEKGLLLVRAHPAGMGGTQKLYRFPNGYGASVVQFLGSYGYTEDLWELAVLKYNGPKESDYKLDYTTPITSDVVGYLNNDEVAKLITQISELPEAKA